MTKFFIEVFSILEHSTRKIRLLRPEHLSRTKRALRSRGRRVRCSLRNKGSVPGHRPLPGPQDRHSEQGAATCPAPWAGKPEVVGRCRASAKVLAGQPSNGRQPSARRGPEARGRQLQREKLWPGVRTEGTRSPEKRSPAANRSLPSIPPPRAPPVPGEGHTLPPVKARASSLRLLPGPLTAQGSRRHSRRCRRNLQPHSRLCSLQASPLTQLPPPAPTAPSRPRGSKRPGTTSFRNTVAPPPLWPRPPCPPPAKPALKEKTRLRAPPRLP